MKMGRLLTMSYWDSLIGWPVVAVAEELAAKDGWIPWAEHEPPTGFLIEAAYRYFLYDGRHAGKVIEVKQVGYPQDIPAGADCLGLSWRLTGVGREQLAARIGGPQ